MLFTLSVQQEPHVEPFLVVVYFWMILKVYFLICVFDLCNNSICVTHVFSSDNVYVTAFMEIPFKKEMIT